MKRHWSVEIEGLGSAWSECEFDGGGCDGNAVGCLVATEELIEPLVVKTMRIGADVCGCHGGGTDNVKGVELLPCGSEAEHNPEGVVVLTRTDLFEFKFHEERVTPNDARGGVWFGEYLHRRCSPWLYRPGCGFLMSGFAKQQSRSGKQQGVKRIPG